MKLNVDEKLQTPTFPSDWALWSCGLIKIWCSCPSSLEKSSWEDMKLVNYLKGYKDVASGQRSSHF